LVSPSGRSTANADAYVEKSADMKPSACPERKLAPSSAIVQSPVAGRSVQSAGCEISKPYRFEVYTTQAVVSGSVPAPDDGDRRGEKLGDRGALAVADDVGRAVAEIEGDDVGVPPFCGPGPSR